MNHSKYAAAVLLATLGFASTTALAADLKLASTFSDHMVLQREAPIRVWGKAAPKTEIVVTLDKSTRKAVADDAGKWSVELDALPAGGPYELSIKSGDDAVTVRDILLGDVWLCSGQSNMQFTLSEAVGANKVIEQMSDDPSVRLLMIPKAAAEKPADGFDAKWTKQDANAIKRFTAVGMFFATQLRAYDSSLKDVPIGLIDSSFGGTRVEGWIPSDKLTPFNPADLGESMFGIKPTQLYNAMIAPLAGTSLKGVLWYQGESNTAKAGLYPSLLTTMIGQWRSDFANAKLPFYLVQLANYPDPWDTYSFAWLREAQAKVAKEVDNVHLATAIDTADGYDLHPKHKSQLGDRLARLAVKHTYGKSIVSQGPTLKAASPDGASMKLDFEIGSSPVELKPGTPSGFEVAGEDGQYFDAIAERVDDYTVRVHAADVKSPRTVRYAFRADPATTLFNREGLPAAPFRTDTAPQTPMVEVQYTRPARRVVSPNYSARIDNDGHLASIQVSGQELFSTDEGGGFVITNNWGARMFFDSVQLGPQSVRYFDSSASVNYTFSELEVKITIVNDGNDPMPTRFLLNPFAKTTDKIDASDKLEVNQSYAFARDHSAITIIGADSAEKLFDVLYQVKLEVKPHASREVTLRLSKPAAK